MKKNIFREVGHDLDLSLYLLPQNISAFIFLLLVNLTGSLKTLKSIFQIAANGRGVQGQGVKCINYL